MPKAKKIKKTEEKQKKKKPFVPSGKTEPLVFDGAKSGKYMDVHCNIKRVKYGETIDTPEEFVEQRLKEGCWKRPEDVVEIDSIDEDKKEEEVMNDGN